MSRHPDPTDTLDPAARAELDALDAALAGEPDATWSQLVREVRAEAPVPRPRAARELDQRVAAGFPRRRPRGLRLPRLHVAVPALACLALLAGVGGVVVAGGGLTETGPLSGELSVDEEGATSASGGAESSAAAGAPASTASGTAPSTAPLTSSPAPLGGRRRVERSTTLELTTDADGLQDAVDGIIRATQDLGGVVERSQVDRTQDGGQATFALRVPTARLDDALERFGALADVARLSEGAEDVTRAFVSAQDRLSDARAERRALLAALGRADTPRAIASLRARIRGNRAEVARLEGDLRGLRRRTDTARVDVTLSASGTAADPGAGAGWGPREAAGDALRVLEVVGGVLLVTGAVLLPVALVAALAVLGRQGLRRRRREAALGPG